MKKILFLFLSAFYYRYLIRVKLLLSRKNECLALRQIITLTVLAYCIMLAEPNNILTAQTISGSIIVGNSPHSIIVNSLTNIIYVTNTNDNNISVISGATNQVLDNIETGESPTCIGLNKSTNKIYIGIKNGLNIIDGLINQLDSTLPLQDISPDLIDVNEKTNMIYTAEQGDNNFLEIDGSNNTVLNTFSLAEHDFKISGFKINAITNNIYLFGSDNRIAVFDSLTKQVTNLIETEPATITGISINQENNVLYFSHDAINSATIVDQLTNLITATIEGDRVKSVGFNPTTNHIFFATTDGAVSIFDGVTNKKKVILGAVGNVFAINPSTNIVYLLDSNADSDEIEHSVTIINDEETLETNDFLRADFFAQGTTSESACCTGITGELPLSVQFTDLSAGSPEVWSWSFGNGNVSTIQNPTNIYAIAGLYTVVLTVEDSLGKSDTRTKNSIVNLLSAITPTLTPITTPLTPITTPSPTPIPIPEEMVIEDIEIELSKIAEQSTSSIICTTILVRIQNKPGTPIPNLEVNARSDNNEIADVLQETEQTNSEGNAFFTICGFNEGETTITFTANPLLEQTISIKSE